MYIHFHSSALLPLLSPGYLCTVLSITAVYCSATSPQMKPCRHHPINLRLIPKLTDLLFRWLCVRTTSWLCAVMLNVSHAHSHVLLPPWWQPFHYRQEHNCLITQEAICWRMALKPPVEWLQFTSKLYIAPHWIFFSCFQTLYWVSCMYSFSLCPPVLPVSIWTYMGFATAVTWGKVSTQKLILHWKYNLQCKTEKNKLSRALCFTVYSCSRNMATFECMRE